jgi:hypothetical protein
MVCGRLSWRRDDRAVAMSSKLQLLTPPADEHDPGVQPDRPGENSRPLPKEGHRLICAFLRIKEEHLREALVTFVEELSNCQAHSNNNVAAPQRQAAVAMADAMMNGDVEEVLAVLRLSGVRAAKFGPIKQRIGSKKQDAQRKICE